MRNLWSFLNRYRGSKNKSLGIGAMWLIVLSLSLPHMYFRPEIFGLSNYTQMGIYSLGSLVGLLMMYKWLWGSAFFHWLKDTSREDSYPVEEGDSKFVRVIKWVRRIPFALTTAYTQKKTGIVYSSSTTHTDVLIYKGAAFTAVCFCRYLFGSIAWFVVTLNPFAFVMATRGVKVAKTYQGEFIRQFDLHVLERSERKVGADDASCVMVFLGGMVIQTLIMVLI